MGSRKDKGPRIDELRILKHAVENAGEAFVTIGENHRVLFFNKAAERIFGYSRDEVIGKDFDVVMSPDCSQSHRDAVRRYVETRAPKPIAHAAEILATRKNGSTFPALISFSVTSVDRKLFFTGIVRDMTETRVLQDRIIHTERLAALGQLVAEITHEIKNPLMMIGGFAKQLTGGTRDKRRLAKLNIISEEVQRLETLLSDLRDFYLPKKPTVGPVDIRDLLTNILSLVGLNLRSRDIRAELSVNEDGLLVAGDADRLKQVFLNLVKNSIEAMDNGGRLSIDAVLSGDQVEVSVADQGCGISEKDRERIFSPFFTTKKHGTGLGLCISKRIVEEDNASSLSVESEEGKGTTIRVKLPAYQMDEQAPPGREMPPSHE